MDKNPLSVYGFILIVVAVFLSILLLVTPYGDYIENLLYGTTRQVMLKAEVDPPLHVTVVSSVYGTASVGSSKYNEGDAVALKISPANGYTYDGATITGGSTTIELDKFQESFVMPGNDVTVTLKFSKAMETKTISDDVGSSVSITVFENNTAVVSGSGKVMADAYSVIENYTFEKLTVENGVTEIGTNAFMDNESLKYLSLPSTIASVKSQAFKGCTALNRVIIHKEKPSNIFTLLTPSSLPASFPQSNIEWLG